MQETMAFIPEHPMLLAQAEGIRRKLAGHSEDDIRLYAHFLDSNIRQLREHPDGSPVPWVEIRRRLPRAVAHRLNGLVEIGSFWIGHARTYRVRDDDIAAHLEIADTMSAEEIAAHPKVIFETMRQFNRRPRSRSNTSARHPEPPLIRDAIAVLNRNGCYADQRAIDAIIHMRRRDFDEARRLYAADRKEYKQAKGRYINDSSCRSAFLDYPLIGIDGSIRHFRPAWYAIRTGRLHARGGGLQSASKEMKRAAYAGIEGSGNYDAESSQPTIAIALLEQAGLNPKWLIDYIQTPNYKDVYGGRVGISGSLFKRIPITMLMGALLPKSVEHARYTNSELITYLAEEATDQAHLCRLLAQTWEVVGDLADVLQRWHKYLLEDYLPANKIRGGYLRNAIGKHFNLNELNLDDPNKRREAGRQIAAHLLQGLEAAVIMEMIARSDEANFKPISCEHDGFIVCSGEPDLGLWEEITRRHGLGALRLVRKEL